MCSLDIIQFAYIKLFWKNLANVQFHKNLFCCSDLYVGICHKEHNIYKHKDNKRNILSEITKKISINTIIAFQYQNNTILQKMLSYLKFKK